MKIGTQNVIFANVGDTEVSKIYIGDTLIYPDYSVRYLTFDVLTPGTIGFKTNGNIGSKTIQYSINNGAWTSLTSPSTSGDFVYLTDLLAGDKIRFKGTNTKYATSNANYINFEGGTATFNISGNIMSLTHGDNFATATSFPDTYTFCSLFKLSNAVSAENLVLPLLTLVEGCYRALFSKAYMLEVAPKILPATAPAKYCYWYMFEDCIIEKAPDLLYTGAIPQYGYGNMFVRCSHLNYIKCLATNVSASNAVTNWCNGVSSQGTFVKNSSMNNWPRGNSGIPNNWTIEDE